MVAHFVGDGKENTEFERLAGRAKNLRKRLKMLVFAGKVWYTLFCVIYFCLQRQTDIERRVRRLRVGIA